MRRQRSNHEDEQEVLVIDQAAAAEQPSDDEVTYWARDQRVFISSVMAELREERRAVADAIRELGAEPVWFEDFGGRDADPENAYLAELGSSTIYIGILGRHYGRLLPTRFSATHTEYNFAEERGLRICVYPLDVPDRDAREQMFLDEVWQFHTASVVTATALPDAVQRRLRRIAAEDLSPWCKLGPNVFRASSVEETRDNIVVAARVRSRDVAHALDEMSGERWSHFTGWFTCGGRCQYVSVTDVEAKTTASTARTYRLVLERKERDRDSWLDVSFDGKSPADLTELAVRSAVLREPNPLDDQHMGFMADFGDPLAPLRKQCIPDEILRPLTHLLLSETLIRGGRITRLTKFRLGAAVAGKRRIELGWETPAYYAREKPDRREATGAVDLP